MTSDTRKRKEIHSQAREMIAKVYHFLREEYDFLKQNNFDNCDLTPLSNVRKRTAEATGVSERTVTQVLKEERESISTPGKRIKKDKTQTAKKKLRNNDEKNFDEEYQKTSMNIWKIRSSELRLIPDIPFLQSLLSNLQYGKTLLQPMPYLVTGLKLESSTSKYPAPINTTFIKCN